MGENGVAHDGYLLAVGSHKGGTGRTTAALALAWLWGRDGLRVTLADADPIRAAGLIALDDSGTCPWPNVRYVSGLPEPGDSALDADVVLIDCPPLLAPEAAPLLGRVAGVVLTCHADPLSLRTVPAAAGVLAAARIQNPTIELIGVLIGGYNAEDVVQAPMLGRLQHMHGDLLLEPPIPDDPAMRDWALGPGSGLPAGRAADAFAAVAQRLRELIRRLSGVALAARRGD
jgi:cellulose biosynthesis protein BcsQ